MIYVKKEPIVDIDPDTGKPRAYLPGEIFPRKIEELIKLGLLEEKEDVQPKAALIEE